MIPSQAVGRPKQRYNSCTRGLFFCPSVCLSGRRWQDRFLMCRNGRAERAAKEIFERNACPLVPRPGFLKSDTTAAAAAK